MIKTQLLDKRLRVPLYHQLKSILLESIRTGARSLYRILREEYGLVAARAQETHSAVPLDATQAALLGAAVGAPALSSQRLTMLASGRPIELVLSVMRGDRYQVVLELSEVHPHWSRKES